jgi:beta-phosphoglucomutase
MSFQKRLQNIPREQYKGFIFDMDGVLFDTAYANKMAYKQAFEQMELAWDGDRFDRSRGLAFAEMLAMCGHTLPPDEIRTLRALKAELYKDQAQHIRINQRLFSFIQEVASSHRVGLASSASRVNGEFLLEHFGVRELFEYTLFSNDVQVHKPDPECYLRMMGLLELSANDTLIFEDSEVGIQAARGSKAECFIVLPEDFLS